MNLFSRYVLASLFFAAANVAAQRCDDIGRFDFQNATIELPSHGLDQQFRFSNGVFEVTLESGGPVEWRFRISKDLTVRPGPQTTIRFLQVSGDHLSGTGTRNYVLGFRCAADSEVKIVFQKEDEGLELVSANADDVQLSSPVWKNSDSHCCPSEVKNTRFAWDKASANYLEKGSTTTIRLSK